MDIVDVEIIEAHVVLLRFAALRVDPDVGTIVWPSGADLAPDVLYEGRPSARMEIDSLTR